MRDLDRQLEHQFPRLFRGRRARLMRPVVRGLKRVSRADALAAFLARSAGVRGFDFVSEALAFLGARYVVEPDALSRIPAHGPLVVIANHPSGALDALALLDMVGRVRRDVRIVANDMLSMLDGLRDLLLPVRVFGGAAGAGSLRAVEEALARGECVIVFPAGEVARLGLRGVQDGP